MVLHLQKGSLSWSVDIVSVGARIAGGAREWKTFLFNIRILE